VSELTFQVASRMESSGSLSDAVHGLPALERRSRVACRPQLNHRRCRGGAGSKAPVGSRVKRQPTGAEGMGLESGLFLVLDEP
jgi:hypothetical protein